MYEGVRDYGWTAYERNESAAQSVGIRWVKTHAQTLGAPRAPKKSDADGLGPASRRLIPFNDFGGRAGLLITGEAPLWLIAEDTSASRIVDCAFRPLYGFVPLIAEKGPLSTIFSLGEDVYAADFPENMDFTSTVPFTKVIEDRLYTEIAFHALSQSYAAIATYTTPFEIFTDDGDPLYSETDPTRQEPCGTRSSLELIEPGSWRTVDGSVSARGLWMLVLKVNCTRRYEFQQYETALSVTTLPLESKSMAGGYKEFIAVGTIITRGEDLATKGAVCLCIEASSPNSSLASSSYTSLEFPKANPGAEMLPLSAHFASCFRKSLSLPCRPLQL